MTTFRTSFSGRCNTGKTARAELVEARASSGGNRSSFDKLRMSGVFTLIPFRLLAVLAMVLTTILSARAAGSVCATVQMQLSQQVTLERQAFDAHMRINNGYTNLTLNNVTVTVQFTDQDQKPVSATSDTNDLTAKFFIKVDTLNNISAVDGTGSVGAATTADIHWLIIPSPGAAGTTPVGALYFVGATLSYNLGGTQKTMDVTPDHITVQPMPLLSMDYFLPTDVISDDAFTPTVVEPPVPFPLGVRVRNSGMGPANNLAIESAQPTITENLHGLLISFNIIGCDVNGAASSPSLLANFGTVAPGMSGVARWMMTTSLSGKFINFNAQMTHSDALGGQLTSLFTSVTPHTLVKDVLVDAPGRDLIPDFLANDGGALHLYDSQNLDAAVADMSSVSSFQPPTGESYPLITSYAPGFVYVKLVDPQVGAHPLSKVLRSDGKTLRSDNVWLSKTRTGSGPWQYWFNLFDDGTAPNYTVTYGDSSTANQPPVFQPIADSSGTETQPLSFTVLATDPQSSPLTLTAASLPVGAVFTDNKDGTGLFTWTPSLGQAGRYEIAFTASDGTLSTPARAKVYISPPIVNLQLSHQPNWVTISTPAWTWTAPSGATGYLVHMDSDTETPVSVPAYTAAPLLDGRHTFFVRAQFGSNFGSIQSDSFGVDTHPPTLWSVSLNGGSLATASLSVTVEMSDDGDGLGSGIVLREVSVDGSSFTALSGSTVTLPNQYGLHQISARLTDAVGHVSQIATASIVYAPAVQTLTGESASGVTAALKDQRSSFYAEVPVNAGRFTFQNVPTGIYGLVVKSTSAAVAYAGRVSLRAGADIDAGDLEPGTSPGAVSGHVVPALEGVPVSAGLNLGRGQFVEVARSTTASDGSYLLNGLAPGTYAIKASPDPSTGFGQAYSIELATAGATTDADVALSSSVVVSGTANQPDAVLTAVGGAFAPFSTDPSGLYSVGLSTGIQTFMGMTAVFRLDPVTFDVEAPMIYDPAFRPLDLTSTGRMTDAVVVLVQDQEPGITKSLQLCDFISRPGAAPVLAARSEEMTTISPDTFQVYDSSPSSPVLCVLSDDQDNDVHSANVADCWATGVFEYSSLGRGGKVQGHVLWAAGGPVVRPMVTLLDSSGNVVGLSEGGPDGRYFFKDVLLGTGYVVQAFDPSGGQAVQSGPLNLAEGDEVSGWDLTVGRGSRVEIVQYPQSIWSGQTVSVNASWEHLPSEQDYQLVLRLESAQGAILAQGTLDQFGDTGTAPISVSVGMDVSSGTYRFGLYCMGRARGYVAASVQTPVDVQVSVDLAGPVLSIPADIVVEAQSPMGTPVPLTATAVDANDPNPVVTSDAPALFRLGVTLVTFTATDFAGNVATASMTVTLVDTTPPVIVAPPDKTVQAQGVYTAVAIGQATATDIFGVFISNDAPTYSNPPKSASLVRGSISPNYIAPNIFAVGTTTVTWKAVDGNGNVATAIQLITVVDNTPPTITAPPNVTAEATAILTPVIIGTPTVTDLFQVTVTNDAPAAYAIGVTTVTWTATDAHGNTATAVQQVNIVDTTPPVVTAPPNMTVEATAVLTEVYIGQATRSDIFTVYLWNDAPTQQGSAIAKSLTGKLAAITPNVWAVPNYFALGKTTVTWTAEDSNGNMATAKQLITVVDTTPPSITAPANVTAEATGVLTSVNVGTATTSDIFAVTVTNNAPASFALGVTTVTWRATDTSGNASTAVQQVKVVDTTPPLLIPPPNKTAEATGVLTVVNIGTATATDPFGVTITNNAPASYALGVTTVTWTATDTHGNKSTALQQVKVVDTTPPVLHVPANVTATATAVLTPVAIGTATATDIFTVTITKNAPASYALGITSVTWKATDANGNSSTGIHQLKVVDTTSPSIHVPSNVTAHATAVLTPVAIGTATATDMFPVTITNNAPSAFALGVTSVTWTATDTSGNAASGIQQVKVVDTTTPTIHVPANVTAEATGVSTPVNIGTATATDIFPVTITNNGPAAYAFGVTTVTWKATDSSGNWVTAVQQIKVVDTTSPTIHLPANVTAEATGTLTKVSIGTATATDAFSVTISSNAPTSYALGVTSVTWTATDAHGNKSTAIQQVKVVDTTPPVLKVPANVTANATAVLTPVAIGTATATDIFTVTITNNAPATYALGVTSVTWKATDANGNASTGIQQVKVVDTTSPTIKLPANVTAQATAVLTPVAIGTATATDIFPVTITNNAPASYALGVTSVTWKATDPSGNASTGIQQVKVVDTTSPTIKVPANVSVVATGVLTPVYIGTATATDIFPVTITNNAPASFAVGGTTVTWTATDSSKNASKGTQLVTVVSTLTASITQVSGDTSTLQANEYWNDKPIVLTYSYFTPLTSTPTVTTTTGTVNATARTVTLAANGYLGNTTVTITVKDAKGLTATASTTIRVVLRVPAGGVTIAPNPFSLSGSTFTATLTMPTPYDATTLSAVTCDGAPSTKITSTKTSATITFNVSGITVLPIDTNFNLRASFTYNGKTDTLQGTGTVSKVNP